ncbi:hypothetical protein [Fimbriiglobus ruber]|uniref:Uncharacterized protein n=1 Tax=Fimbriiglobus ruber TaxID=1908690 RepID=A0A225E0D0_9BACT|nr:hypothetical protein [Fimbriiglobus ruber]OWK47190.1 hypothetical protein FRUB_00889 [Fimbriiglobus ruber]
MATFDLILRTGGCLHPTAGDPSEFASEYDGLLTCRSDEGIVTNVGRIHAIKLHAALAAEHHASLLELCDAHSDELFVLYALLYEPNGYVFREQIARRFEAYESDLLILDYVVLHPKWRGLKVGLMAVRKLIDLVGGGCGLVVTDVAPLRTGAHTQLRVPRSWIPNHTTAAGYRDAAVKIRRYFRKMGFRRLGRTPFYALPTSLQMPTAADLLRRPTME